MLRLPSYHYHFNAIEMVWGVKKSINGKNISNTNGKTEDILNVWAESLDKISEKKASFCVNHTEKITCKAKKVFFDIMKRQVSHTENNKKVLFFNNFKQKEFHHHKGKGHRTLSFFNDSSNVTFRY